jgi:hypothetical protein
MIIIIVGHEIQHILTRLLVNNINTSTYLNIHTLLTPCFDFNRPDIFAANNMQFHSSHESGKLFEFHMFDGLPDIYGSMRARSITGDDLDIWINAVMNNSGMNEMIFIVCIHPHIRCL